MSSPAPDYRVVAGLRVPLPLVPRIIAALCARYPEATAGITDPDAMVRAALKAWVVESLASFEETAAMAPLNATIAQTVTTFEKKANAARDKALEDSLLITDDSEVPSGT